MASRSRKRADLLHSQFGNNDKPGMPGLFFFALALPVVTRT